MIDDAVAVFFGDFILQRFDFRIVEFGYFAAFHANDVVVVIAFVQFVNRFAGFKMVALQNAGLFKLGQHTVNRRHADFHALFQQDTVHIFRTQMLLGMSLEQVQNFQTWTSNFQTAVFQLRNVAEFFHNIQYPCKVITVIIRTFRPFAHYWAVKGWQSAAGLAIENRRKEKLRR